MEVAVFYFKVLPVKILQKNRQQRLWMSN